MSISRDDCNRALERLYRKWQKSTIVGDWTDVRLLTEYDTRFLRITRHFKHEHSKPADIDKRNHDFDDADDDSDEEALRPVKNDDPPQHVAVYDIVHSPSYQVPVLYVNIQGLAASQRNLNEGVTELLVPHAYRSQVIAVGVMGALSITEHPVSGLPAYFLHPCQTQEAMSSVSATENATPERYLAMWIGMVGASVGLSMPIELAKELEA